MKGLIYCPRCAAHGRRKLLGKHEDIHATSGDLILFCKVCKKEVRVPLESISLDR